MTAITEQLARSGSDPQEQAATLKKLAPKLLPLMRCLVEIATNLNRRLRRLLLDLAESAIRPLTKVSPPPTIREVRCVFAGLLHAAPELVQDITSVPVQDAWVRFLKPLEVIGTLLHSRMSGATRITGLRQRNSVLSLVKQN